jgi:hypothetical protein
MRHALADRGVWAEFGRGLIKLKMKIEAANTMAAGVEPLGSIKPADSQPAEDRQ